MSVAVRAPWRLLELLKESLRDDLVFGKGEKGMMTFYLGALCGVVGGFFFFALCATGKSSDETIQEAIKRREH